MPHRPSVASYKTANFHCGLFHRGDPCCPIEESVQVVAMDHLTMPTCVLSAPSKHYRPSSRDERSNCTRYHTQISYRFLFLFGTAKVTVNIPKEELKNFHFGTCHYLERDESQQVAQGFRLVGEAVNPSPFPPLMDQSKGQFDRCLTDR